MSSCLSYRSDIFMSSASIMNLLRSSASVMIFTRRRGRPFGEIRDRGVGREQQSRDRGGVLQGGADDFRGVHDAGLEQVFDLARRRVVPDILLFGANLADD